MKRIVIIDHFSKAPGEPGNNRFVYLGELLCSYGFDVEIITTTFAHLKKKQRKVVAKLYDNLPYKYTMLPEPGYPRNVCLKRLYSHYIFGKHLSKYLEAIKKPDVIIAAVPSLDVAGTAAKYAQKEHIPFVVDIQDLWPEAFEMVLKIPVVSKVVFWPMKCLANRIYRSADHIVAVSETYANRALQANPHGDTTVVYLGTEKKQFDAYTENPVPKELAALFADPDVIRLGYAGTLGHSYDLPVVLDAMRLLPEEKLAKLHFVVMGDGPKQQEFEKAAAGLPVTFTGRIPYSDMVWGLSHCDIVVNPIVPGAPQSIINKHADYAMAGIPVINTQACPEYREMVDRWQMGINCTPGEAKELAQGLEELLCNADMRAQMGANARRCGETCFDRSTTYTKLVDRIRGF